MESTWLITVAAILGVVMLLGWVFWAARENNTLDRQVVSKVITRRDAYDIRHNRRDSVLKAVAAAALLLAFFATQHTIRQTQESINLQSQGQVTDQFMKFAEMLNSDQEGLRIAAIYGFEGLMNTPPADKQAIVDIIAAFVRERATPPETLPGLPVIEDTCDRSIPRSGPAADVSAAMTVLSRRDPSEETHSLDLRHVYLAGLELPIGAQLQNTFFDDANLSYAKMWAASLEYASLQNTRLISTCLRGAMMQGADFYRADFHWATLDGIEAPGANFSCAAMQEVRLIGATDLTGTRFSDSDLQGASLRTTLFAGALLPRANFANADLTDTDLRGADLERVNGLTDEQVDSAVTDETTVLPDGPRQWPAQCDGASVE